MDVSRLRAMALRYLEDTCTILRGDPVTGTGRTVVATGIACQVQTQLRQPGMVLDAASPAGSQKYTLRWPVGTDVRSDDTIRITSWSPTVDFTVIAPQAPRSAQVVMMADCERLTGAA